MAYGNNGNNGNKQVFVKTKDEIKAPAGFHYMPNGKLMSDADHVAVHGYIEQKITSFYVDTRDILHEGETRTFEVNGSDGAVFSLEIYDDTGKYYNFYTKTWSTEKAILSKQKISAKAYNVSVKFPILGFVDATCDYDSDPTITHDDDDGAIEAGMSVTGTGIPNSATVSSVTSDTAFELSASTTGDAITNGSLRFSKLKTYTINLFAETVHNIKTVHAPLVESRNADNSININAATGSNSNIVTKIIYQDVLKTFKLSCVAPSLYETSADTVNGATSGTNRIVVDADATDTNIVRVGDKLVTTGIASAVHALVTKVNPDGDNVNEIEISVSDSASDGAIISFTPPFNGMTPHDDESDAGSKIVSLSSGSNTKVGFSVSISPLTGRTFNVLRTPTVNDLCAYTTVTFESAALAIEGEDTSSASVFYRWPITNIANLTQGMVLDPARSGAGGAGDTTTPASISNYRTTTTQKIIKEGDYNNYINSITVDDILVDAVDAYANDVTTVDRNGRVTAQKGNIIFDKQQADALKSNTVRIFAYGQAGIEALTGIKVKLSVTSMAYAGSTNPVNAAVSTTTSGAVSSSTTIGLAEVRNISQGMTVSGVGINAAVANPIVVSKNAISGAGNITVSAAQTLESGQTLYFNGGSQNVTIRGNLEVSNMAIGDVNLFFDVEKFLTAV